MGRYQKDGADKARKASLSKITGDKSKGKAGRPRGGKRDDPDWLARSFFLETETDGLVDETVYLAKRRGNRIDKSDVVNTLVRACLEFRQDKNTESLIESIEDIRPSHADPLKDIGNT